MIEVVIVVGVYEIFDNFGFYDFEKVEECLCVLCWRWWESYKGKLESWKFLWEKYGFLLDKIN